jgi:hypothetical protein
MIPSSLPSPATVVCLALAVVLPTGGCDFQRTVDLTAPDHKSTLVLNGKIVPGMPWRLDVSRSVGAFEPGTPSDSRFTVTDATVSIFEEGKRQGNLPLDSLNQYSSRKFLPAPGRQYTVRVSAPGLDTAEATGCVPRMPPVQLTEEKLEGDDYYDRTLRLTINDPPNTDEYYQIRLLKNGYHRDSTAIDTVGLTDERFRTRSRSIINEMEQSLEDVNTYKGRKATFKDVLFGGTEHTLRLQVPEGRLYLPDQEAGDGYPRVKYILYVSVLSEDAYQFNHTQRIFEQTEENPFAEPVDVHSNVEGGDGIVAGRHTDTLEVEVTLE